MLLGAFFAAKKPALYGQLDEYHSSNTSEATSRGLEPEIGFTSPGITTKSSYKDTLNQSCISRKGLASYPRSSVLYSFKTTDLQQCWRYCKVTGQCEVFLFHFITRICSLYKNNMLIYQLESDPNISVAMLECLECIGEVREVIEKSKSGVLIKMLQKCLSVEHSENGTNYNYQLSWKNCKKADLWRLSKIENYSGANNDRDFVRISKINSNLELNWMIKDGGFGLIFPNEKSNISSRSLLIDKSTIIVGSVCKFEINSNLDEHDVYPVQLNTMDGQHPSLPLTSISFALPFSPERCSLQQFSVQHGVVINLEEVPYFLPGTSVQIQCKPGYGVKALNYTPSQRVICHKSTRPRPCSVFKCGMESNKNELVLYLILVLILSFTTIASGIALTKCIIRLCEEVEDAAPQLAAATVVINHFNSQ